ncbi:hypothetical protein ACMDCT_07305 [Halomonadaceae bacterium KBTZ08]
MIIVVKLAVLIGCIWHVLAHGQPGKTSGIYAGTFLILGAAASVIKQELSLFIGIDITLNFVYDLATGFVFFWLLDRYQDNLFLFYLIIILGIVVNLAVKFVLVDALLPA